MQVRQQRPPPLPNPVPKRSVCLLLAQPGFSLSANVATNFAMHRNSAKRQRSEYLPAIFHVKCIQTAPWKRLYYLKLKNSTMPDNAQETEKRNHDTWKQHI